ncbi:MAG: aspartate/glutamate racemase family protein [Pseudomonadota bacterium]
MKTIGIIGGMSWASTSSYYQRLNQLVNERLGGLHSAELILVSVDFAGIEQQQREGDWQGAGERLARAARQLEAAGAEAIVIATNTMHKVAERVANAVDLPLIHIVDAVAKTLKQQDIDSAGLLGTRFTMQQPFYTERLEQQNIHVLIPDAQACDRVDAIIFNELCLGQFAEPARQYYLQLITELAQQGAQGVILGCTEIGLLIEQKDTELPLFDTTELHCQTIVDWMLNQS